MVVIITALDREIPHLGEKLPYRVKIVIKFNVNSKLTKANTGIESTSRKHTTLATIHTSRAVTNTGTQRYAARTGPLP